MLLPPPAAYVNAKDRRPELLRRAELAAKRFVALPRAHKAGAALAALVVVWILGALARASSLAAEARRGAVLFAATGRSAAGTIPILMPAYGRPHYLRRVLDSLRANAHINETVLVFSQDGDNAEVSALIRGITFAPVVHLRHAPPYLGLPSLLLRTDAPTASNVHFLLSVAFETLRVPAAIVLESDIELGVDGFDFFRWAFGRVAADAALRARVLTVNGYNARSAPNADRFTVSTDDDGFMVWGWLCPAWSWPELKAGWTWFGNWDITVENSIRRPSGKVSLSPLASRTRNIGMQGINFDIRDPSEVAAWEGLYLPPDATEFGGRELRVLAKAREAQAAGVDAAATAATTAAAAAAAAGGADRGGKG